MKLHKMWVTANLICTQKKALKTKKTLNNSIEYDYKFEIPR